MSAKFIAGVLAVATTIAAFSVVPARADRNDDLAKVVAGVATLYIAGKLIDELADNGAVVPVHETRDRYGHDRDGGRYGRDSGRYGHNDGRYDRDHGRYGYYDGRSGPRAGHWGKPQYRKVVPANCIRKIHTRHTQYVLPRYCLTQNDVSLRHLPRSCEVNWRSDRGPRRGYALGCLKRYGYQIARGR